MTELMEGKCGGRPVVVGTRVFPDLFVDSFQMGDTVEELHENFPNVPFEQIQRLVDFAREQRVRAAA